MEPNDEAGTDVSASGSGSIGIGGSVTDSQINTTVTNNYWSEPPSVAIPSLSPPGIQWPVGMASHAPTLANRESEFEFFRKMVAGNTAKRALFLEAETNHGKSIFIDECKRYACTFMPCEACVFVDFKTSPAKDDALSTLRLELGSLLPHFARPNSTTFELRADLRALIRPTLLFFDSYEKASSDAGDFLKTLILSDLEKLPAVRLIVAGQKVPEYTRTLWSSYVQHFSLGPIKDLDKWQNLANSKYPSLKSEHIFAVIISTGGIPGSIIAGLEAVHTAIGDNYGT